MGVFLIKPQGRVTSFYGTELQRYTSFKAHLSANGPVRQILVNDKGVIALGAKDVHMALRRGPPLWHIRLAPPHSQLAGPRLTSDQA